MTKDHHLVGISGLDFEDAAADLEVSWHGREVPLAGEHWRRVIQVLKVTKVY